MKKLLSIFTAIILLVSPLFSCDASTAGNDKGTEAGSIDNSAMTDAFLSDELGTYDFGGYEFRILTRSTDVHPQYIDSEAITGEIINDAVYNRNRTIEERFNVKIKALVVHENKPESDNINSTVMVQKNITAGDDLCDIAMLHMIDAGRLASENMFLDWYNVPSVDLSKPWWDKDVVEGLTIGGKLYINTGDFNLDNYDFTWGMVFNKKLWNDYNLDDVYMTVSDGKWTLDYFVEVIKTATKDLNGDGNYTEEDQWGYITLDRGALTNFMFGSDHRIYVKNNDGGFDLVLNTPRMQSIVEKTNDIFYNNNSTYFFSSKAQYFPEMQPLDMFTQDKGLIASARLAAMPILRGMDTDFGIIPQPKFDESQKKYLSFTDGHASMMVIPTTAAGNLEKVGTIIEALSAENYNTVMKSYYDINLSTKFVRDEESAAMLDIIIGSRIFDIGYVYNNTTGGLGFIINELISAGNTAFTSTMAKKEASALIALEKLLQNFEKND